MMTAKRRSAVGRTSKVTQPNGENAVTAEADDIDRLAAKIITLATRQEADFFELANALATIRALHSKVFEEIIGRSGISRRRAYYLLEIRDRFQPFMQDLARLRAIGWTKLKVLAPFISAENAGDLFAMAETSSAYKLGQVLRGADVSSKPRCVLLYLTPEQHDLYERAILAHGGKRRGRQLIDQERALVAIIDQVNARHH